MDRVLVEWSGPQIEGLAVSVLHTDFEAGSPDPAAVTNAFGALNAILPVGVVLDIPNTGDTIDAATGQLTGTWGHTNPPGQMLPTGGAAAAAGVGACVTWLTSDVVNGRRVRGRTFIVPLSTDGYQDDGTLTPAAVTALGVFAGLLIAESLVVWHRPTTVGGSNGSEHAVTSFKVSDRVAVLRSRRF